MAETEVKDICLCFEETGEDYLIETPAYRASAGNVVRTNVEEGERLMTVRYVWRTPDDAERNALLRVYGYSLKAATAIYDQSWEETF